MESTSLPGRIQISRSTYGRIYDLFEFEERSVEVKGKGTCLTYLLKHKHHENPVPDTSTISTSTTIPTAPVSHQDTLNTAGSNEIQPNSDNNKNTDTTTNSATTTIVEKE